MIRMSKATETISVAGMAWLADVYKREAQEAKQ